MGDAGGLLRNECVNGRDDLGPVLAEWPRKPDRLLDVHHGSAITRAQFFDKARHASLTSGKSIHMLLLVSRTNATSTGNMFAVKQGHGLLNPVFVDGEVVRRQAGHGCLVASLTVTVSRPGRQRVGRGSLNTRAVRASERECTESRREGRPVEDIRRCHGARPLRYAGLELVAHAETDLPGRLQLRQVQAARLPEVRVQHREARLRIGVVIERPLRVEQVEHVSEEYHTLPAVNRQSIVGVHGGRVEEWCTCREPVDRVEAGSARAFGNLSRRLVDRVCRQRRQWLARGEGHPGTEVQGHSQAVAPEQLDLVRPIERQRPLAERAEEADATAVPELRHADGRVARVVRREIEE